LSPTSNNKRAEPVPIPTWAEVERLLDQALDLAPAERSRFLDQGCSGDLALRAEVERLLQAAEGAGSFLSEPAPAYASPVVGRVAEFEVTTKPHSSTSSKPEPDQDR
jgi:hypothetical protein